MSPEAGAEVGAADDETIAVEPVDQEKQWKLVAAVLALLLVAALITLVVLARHSEDDASVPDASAQVRLDAEHDADAAAKKAAVSLTTYDWATLDEDFSWAEDAGTAKFQDQYAEVSAPIRKLVLELKAHAEGSVVDSAARATDADHVTVLLFVDQTLTNQGSSERKLDQPRMTMSMVREGGRWLVDEVKLSNLTDS
jgi:Mce-associated membrane protein